MLIAPKQSCGDILFASDDIWDIWVINWDMVFGFASVTGLLTTVFAEEINPLFSVKKLSGVMFLETEHLGSQPYSDGTFMTTVGETERNDCSAAFNLSE